MKLGGELLGRYGASSCGFRGSIDRSTVYIGRAMNFAKQAARQCMKHPIPSVCNVGRDLDGWNCPLSLAHPQFQHNCQRPRTTEVK